MKSKFNSVWSWAKVKPSGSELNSLGICPNVFSIELKFKSGQINVLRFTIQFNAVKGQSEQVKVQIKSFHRSVLCGPGHRSIRPHQPNQLGLGFKWVSGPKYLIVQEIGNCVFDFTGIQLNAIDGSIQCGPEQRPLRSRQI